MDDFTFIGIKIGHLLAGVAGGTVRAIVMKNSFVEGFFSAVTGSVTAAYLTEPVFSFVKHYVGFADFSKAEYATSFVVGMTAMSLCEGFIRWAKRWAKSPNFPGVGK